MSNFTAVNGSYGVLEPCDPLKFKFPEAASIRPREPRSPSTALGSKQLCDYNILSYIFVNYLVDTYGTQVPIICFDT